MVTLLGNALYCIIRKLLHYQVLLHFSLSYDGCYWQLLHYWEIITLWGSTGLKAPVGITHSILCKWLLIALVLGDISYGINSGFGCPPDPEVSGLLWHRERERGVFAPHPLLYPPTLPTPVMTKPTGKNRQFLLPFPSHVPPALSACDLGYSGSSSSRAPHPTRWAPQLKFQK